MPVYYEWSPIPSVVIHKIPSLRWKCTDDERGYGILKNPRRHSCTATAGRAASKPQLLHVAVSLTLQLLVAGWCCVSFGNYNCSRNLSPRGFPFGRTARVILSQKSNSSTSNFSNTTTETMPPKNSTKGLKMSLGDFMGGAPADELGALPTGPRQRG